MRYTLARQDMNPELLSVDEQSIPEECIGWGATCAKNRVASDYWKSGSTPLGFGGMSYSLVSFGKTRLGGVLLQISD